MANILILGGGFGGLMTAEHLTKLLGSIGHRITLVAPNDKLWSRMKNESNQLWEVVRDG